MNSWFKRHSNRRKKVHWTDEEIHSKKRKTHTNADDLFNDLDNLNIYRPTTPVTRNVYKNLMSFIREKLGDQPEVSPSRRISSVGCPDGRCKWATDCVEGRRGPGEEGRSGGHSRSRDGRGSEWPPQVGSADHRFLQAEWSEWWWHRMHFLCSLYLRKSTFWISTLRTMKMKSSSIRPSSLMSPVVKRKMKAWTMKITWNTVRRLLYVFFFPSECSRRIIWLWPSMILEPIGLKNVSQSSWRTRIWFVRPRLTLWTPCSTLILYVDRNEIHG